MAFRVASGSYIRYRVCMASLQPVRKMLLGELREALLAADMERRRLKELKWDVFVKVAEISLALAPILRIRYRQLRLDCWISAFDREFERSMGCEPFEVCSFETFSGYCANFEEFRGSGWINPNAASEELGIALQPYLALAARYPATRSAMAAELRSGSFGGLQLKHFAQRSAKTKSFLDWLGVSGTLPLPN